MILNKGHMVSRVLCLLDDGLVTCQNAKPPQQGVKTNLITVAKVLEKLFALPSVWTEKNEQ